MTVAEVVNALSLKVVASNEYLNREVKGGFVGDLLSVVMGKAKEDQVWVTIQGHVNIVAIASLINLSCIIVTEGFEVEEEAIKKANEEEVVILASSQSSYEVVKQLISLGI